MKERCSTLLCKLKEQANLQRQEMTNKSVVWLKTINIYVGMCVGM